MSAGDERECPEHGKRFLYERRGIGSTMFRCDQCAWKSREFLTELFKHDWDKPFVERWERK